MNVPPSAGCFATIVRRRCNHENRHLPTRDREHAPDWSETVAFADWQGVAYPAQWGAAEIAGLLESLHAVNYHTIAAIVAELTSD